MSGGGKKKDPDMAFVGGNVPAQLAKDLKRIADENERSVVRELRVAIRAHVEAHQRSAA